MAGGKSVRLLNLGLTDPIQTQSIYHAVAELMTEDSPDTVILCRPRLSYLCLGYHQNYRDVLDSEVCARLGIPVVRRKLGGGATYLDSDQLFYQFIFHKSRMPAQFRQIYSQLLQPPVDALKGLGLDARLRAENEIEIGGKRIAGIGGGFAGEACVVVGNVLFDFDYETMSAVWNCPTESFRDLARRALRDRLTTLRQIDATITFGDLEVVLIGELEKVFGSLLSATLNDEEIEASRRLNIKLTSEQFLASASENGRKTGRAPLKISAYTFIHYDEAWVGGQWIRGSFRVDGGIIIAAQLESARGMVLKDEGELLVGVRFQDWRQTLEAAGPFIQDNLRETKHAMA